MSVMEPPVKTEPETITEVDVLKYARDLIADKEHWVQGALAVDDDGDEVCVTNSRATRFCVLGAISHASFKLGFPGPGLHRLADDDYAVKINDHVGHGAVLMLLDNEIARLES